MAKRKRTPARPTDINQLAKRIVDISTGDVVDDAPVVNEAASKRGNARAAKLTPEQRRKIAKKAAGARWQK